MIITKEHIQNILIERENSLGLIESDNFSYRYFCLGQIDVLKLLCKLIESKDGKIISKPFTSCKECDLSDGDFCIGYNKNVPEKGCWY